MGRKLGTEYLEMLRSPPEAPLPPLATVTDLTVNLLLKKNHKSS